MKRYRYLKIFLGFLLIFILTVVSIGVYDYFNLKSAGRKMNEYEGIIETEIKKRTLLTDSMLTLLQESKEDDVNHLKEINEQLKEISNLDSLVSKNAELRRQIYFLQKNLLNDEQEQLSHVFDEFDLTENALLYATEQYNQAALEYNEIQRHIPICFLKDNLNFNALPYLYYGEKE